MNGNTLNFLGLMKKAGVLGSGEQAVTGDIKSGKAVLVMEAEDISANSRKRVESLAEYNGIEYITLPYTKDELADALGAGLCSMLSCRDRGFASAFRKKLEGGK